jgi:hypothetical protein
VGSTNSLQSLQSSKSSKSIIIIQPAIKVHNTIIDSTYDAIVLFIPRVKILKLLFQFCKKGVRNGSKKHIKSRSVDEIKGLKQASWRR